MTAAGRSVSVVMPVYNEAELLRPAVASVSEFLAARPDWEFEIVIVESGSTDGSDQIADELAGQNSKVRVLHEGAKRGFGSGVRLGYSQARKDWVWLVTADLPFPLVAFDQAAVFVDDYDAILSYRSADNRSALRHIWSGGYFWLSKVILGLPFRSVNSAFKLLRRDLVARLDLRENGWIVDAELLRGIHRSHARWVEIPVPLVERTAGASSVGAMTPLAMLADLVRLRFR
jgi:dolichol-phosphate mannosyltransferase